MRYISTILMVVSSWIGCRAGGADLERLASESNKTWLSLDRAFTEWSESESEAIDAEASVNVAERRLDALEESLTKWAAIRQGVLTMLQALEAGREIDAAKLRDVLKRAGVFIGEL